MGSSLTSRPLTSAFAFARKATSGALSLKKASLKASGEDLPKKEKRPNEDFFAMLKRMFRAGTKRVQQPHDLADLLLLEAQLKTAIKEAGYQLRRDGYSLGEIANALGCSQMNVSKRWRLPEEAPGGEA